jgi:hypothetical protein
MRLKSSWLQKVMPWGWLILPLLICLIIMLPRLLSPQFGLEDDGTSLQVAQQWTSGKFNITPGPDLVSGRFRPFYWAGLTLIYLLGGKNPAWYYLSNALVLMLTVVSLTYLVRARGTTKLQAGMAGCLFAIASPVIEPFYTISKQEPLQVAWLLFSLVPIFGIFPKSTRGKVIAFLASLLALTCASLSKETTLAMIPVSLAWLALKWLFHRKDRQAWLTTALYAGASVFAGVIFLLLRGFSQGGWLTLHGYSGHYQLDLNFILFMLNYWIAYFLRDFLGLFLCLLLLVVSLSRRIKAAERELLFASVIWMGAWVAIFLPWEAFNEYYLLPFCVGYAVFCGVVLGIALQPPERLSLPRRMVSYASLVILALFLITTLFNNYSNGRTQLTMDRQDNALFNYVIQNIRAQDQLLATASKSPTFLRDINLNLKEIGGRPDIQVGPFAFQTPEPGEATDISYYLITADIQNRPLFSVRLPDEAASQSSQAMHPFLGMNAEPVFASSEQFRLFDFNLVKLLCPLVKNQPLGWIYCKNNAAVVDRNEFSHVWRIYRVTKDLNSLPSPAVFLTDGTWKFKLPDGSIKTLHFGQPGDKPLVGDWTGSGRTCIGVFNPVTLTWSLDDNLDGQADVTFQLHGMVATDIPLVGDWNCSGKDTPGFFRPSDGSWHFWTANYSGPEDLPVLAGTEAGVVPLVGDWNGDGCDTVGVYRPAKGEVNLENTLTADLTGADFFAPKNALPVAADWSGTGIETLAFFDSGNWTRLFTNCDCTPANPPATIQFGQAGDIPVAGRWSTGK